MKTQMSEERQLSKFDNEKVLNQIAIYTILNGPVFSGGNFDRIRSTNRYGNEILRRRKEIIQYFEDVIAILLKEGDLSELVYQVLSNVNQKLTVKNPDLEEVIDYVSLWMKKIEMREELTADEELIKEIFSVDTVLKDLDSAKLLEKIQRNHENFDVK